MNVTVFSYIDGKEEIRHDIKNLVEIVNNHRGTKFYVEGEIPPALSLPHRIEKKLVTYKLINIRK